MLQAFNDLAKEQPTLMKKGVNYKETVFENLYESMSLNDILETNALECEKFMARTLNSFVFLEDLNNMGILHQRLGNSELIPSLVMTDSEYWNDKNDDLITDFKNQFEIFSTIIINE